MMNTNRLLPIFLVLFQFGFLLHPVKAANKYKTISAASCDSLIKANDLNPDFVILDVRQPSVWLNGHLSGSINRDYYSADFNTQISVLPRHKMYLLHCQSGGRSAVTFSLMKSLNFVEVYEMSGGINSWIGGGYPTTSKVAPRIMLVSKSGLVNNRFRYGIADTLNLTITNRANDTLRITSASVSGGSEFPTDINLKHTLTGSDDYTFSVFYKPLQIWKDSVIVLLVSNGGNVRVAVPLEKQTGFDLETITNTERMIYPNPAKGYFRFNLPDGKGVQEIVLINMKGQVVKRVQYMQAFKPVSVNDLPEGLYFVCALSESGKYVEKLLIKR